MVVSSIIGIVLVAIIVVLVSAVFLQREWVVSSGGTAQRLQKELSTLKQQMVQQESEYEIRLEELREEKQSLIEDRKQIGNILYRKSIPS